MHVTGTVNIRNLLEFRFREFFHLEEEYIASSILKKKKNIMKDNLIIINLRVLYSPFTYTLSSTTSCKLQSQHEYVAAITIRHTQGQNNQTNSTGYGIFKLEFLKSLSVALAAEAEIVERYLLEEEVNAEGRFRAGTRMSTVSRIEG
jgi:hypothetical protein